MNSSLKSRVIRLVLMCLACVLLPLVVLSYFFMMEEVDELSDARLAQNARTISALAGEVGKVSTDHTGPTQAPVEIVNWRKEHDAHPLIVRGHHYETQIGFQYWNDQNQLVMNSANLAGIGLDAAPAGFADIPIGGRQWRIFTLLADNKTWVRVGERYDSRREIARALAVEAIAPLLIGLPLLVLLVGWAVNRGLSPLRDLADRIAERRPDKTDPLGIVDAPGELVPVVASLNGLLGRLRSAIEQERQFTANAAHELRTPLAGVLLNVENARAAETAFDASQSLERAELGLTRLTRIVNQMLELARWDAAGAQEMSVVDLAAVIASELQELGLATAEKDLEIALRCDDEARLIEGWLPGLATLVRNLLDNAVRYSFPGQRIDIELTALGDKTRLSISDSGPGIDAALRKTVFKRFQRGNDGSNEGSGLGLAIVARVAELHRAALTLSDSAGRSGLRVDIEFARARERS